MNEILLNPLPAIKDKTGLVNVHRWQSEKDVIATTAAATIGPAWRASRVQPALALRAN